MNIKELITQGTKKLKEKNIEDANIKAKALVENVLNVNKTFLIVNEDKEVLKKQIDIYNRYIQKVIMGMPLQYITKSQEFMGYNFYVNKNVLIPQPDTEILVEEVIKIIQNKQNKNKLNILDMCTGSRMHWNINCK